MEALRTAMGALKAVLGPVGAVIPCCLFFKNCDLLKQVKQSMKLYLTLVNDPYL